MNGLVKTALRRATGARLPIQEEIEQFGSAGEEAVCRILYQNFDCVIRNVVVPHKELYLEKDFLVIERGVPFVLEIKNWKGEIGSDGRSFYQNKDNGVRKTLKSPVGTTNQFIKVMKDFYHIEREVVGVVVFAEPDCRLSLPEEMEGVALMDVGSMVSYIRTKAKSEAKAAKGKEEVDHALLLRCTRLYSFDREFCKGILVDPYFTCFDEQGAKVRLDTTMLRYLTVEHQPLTLRDKLYVTFQNGATGIYFNHDASLTVGCLDGSYRSFALNRIRHIVF